MARHEAPVLIAGAGIGGLTLALALARYQISSIVLEREHRLEEVGAGIQISPNASRILITLGLEHALRRVAGEPMQLCIRSGIGGAVLNSYPLSGTMQKDYGAPYFVIHRADLQSVLLAEVHKTSRIELRLGSRFTGFDELDEGVRALTSGESVEGRALIGADGLNSAVRAITVGDGAPSFAGYIAWRGVTDSDSVSPSEHSQTGLWLAPRAHLVHYPIRQGKEVNVVAIVSQWGGDRTGDQAFPFDRFAHWCPAAQSILHAVPRWHRWPLYDRPPLRRWSRSRVTLLGDAAHPMLPFVAQAGAMAIEDAATLARCLTTHDRLESAFLEYEQSRHDRTARMQREARSNGLVFHLPQPLARVRDAIIAGQSPRTLSRRHAWIYEWRPEW